MTKIDRNKINSLAFTPLCTAIICVSSFFALPLPFGGAALTLQSMAICLTALCLKKEHSLCAVALYILMGLVGLPVFPGGTSGLSRLLSPVGGYYIGFLAAAFLISRFKGKSPSFKRYATTAVFIGIPAEHICAVLFMCVYSHCSPYSAFMSLSLPFLAGDIIKAVAAAFVAVPLAKTVKRI